MLVSDIILYFSLKYGGEWRKIYDAIYRREEINIEEFISMKEKLKCKYVTIIDKNYPEELRYISQPPYVIYYYGNYNLLKIKNKIAVVGSRENGEYSKRAMNYILSGLKDRNDTSIISGMALGVDSIAHNISFDVGIPTIAVLGTGIEYCYPKENFKIYEKIKKEGLILSEYPYKENVDAKQFSMRNRIITGLSSFLFVPEVHERSGTMVSIRYALSQGKDILTIPFSIFDDNFSNSLIQEGAKLVTCPNDLIEELK